MEDMAGQVYFREVGVTVGFVFWAGTVRKEIVSGGYERSKVGAIWDAVSGE